MKKNNNMLANFNFMSKKDSYNERSASSQFLIILIFKKNWDLSLELGFHFGSTQLLAEVPTHKAQKYSQMCTHVRDLEIKP